MTIDDVFTVIIEDDGQGIQQKKTRKGIGLRNIEGRASIFSRQCSNKNKAGKRFSSSHQYAYRLPGLIHKKS